YGLIRRAAQTSGGAPTGRLIGVGLADCTKNIAGLPHVIHEAGECIECGLSPAVRMHLQHEASVDIQESLAFALGFLQREGTLRARFHFAQKRFGLDEKLASVADLSRDVRNVEDVANLREVL